MISQGVSTNYFAIDSKLRNALYLTLYRKNLKRKGQLLKESFAPSVKILLTEPLESQQPWYQNIVYGEHHKALKSGHY